MSSITPIRAVRASILALALSAFALLAIAPAPAARANSSQFSVMMDDDLLLYRSDETRDQALRRMKSLGVEIVRVTVLWEVIGEYARTDKNGRRRRGFRAENPSTYPRRNWDRYDRLVRAAHNLGIRVYFNVTGPGPRWAHKPTSVARNRRAWKPKPREFYKFAAAVGKRFSGSYVDENDARLRIPRVNIWSIWNEPNQGGWLLPQWENVGGRLIPAAPHLYRELYFFGRKALNDTGHGRDLIMVGETAPIGRPGAGTRENMRPVPFIRELFCLNPQNQPYAGADAVNRKCNLFDKFGPIQATAWAHHPYTRKLAPTVRDSSPESLTMANIGELPNLLDTIATTTNRLPAGLNVMLSEYGYETSPPDRFAGVSYAKQAEYNNLGEFLAFLNPRIIGQTQFLLRDVDPVKRHRRGSKAYWSTYQSGIYTRADKAKPGARAYALPFVMYPQGTDPATGKPVYQYWGQLRFRPNGVNDRALLQFRVSGGTTFVNVGQIDVTDPRGYFNGTVQGAGAGTWRVLWRGNGVPSEAISRDVPVGA